MLKEFYTQYSKDNYEVIRVNVDDKWNYIGSIYNMKKEIENIQTTISKVSSLKSIIVFGAANGAWLKNIDNVTTSKEIIIVEPSKELFNKFIKNSFDIKNNIVRATCIKDDNFYQNLLSAVSKPNFEILVFSNYDIIFNEEFQVFIDKIKFMHVDKKIGENTQSFYAKNWFENYMKNILEINSFEKIDSYKGMFKNKPAIIVSAGPSLDKNLKFLKGNEDKFIIIAGARTLKTLEKEGIKTDFACIIDSSQEMYNVFKNSLNSEVPLVTIDQGNNEIVKKYKGKKIIFNSREFSNASRSLLGFNTEYLFQGGSVAHTCTSFAKLLGCDPIIFIGQDLAYTNNKLHAENATVENENNEIIDTGIYVKGVVEEKVLTNYDLNMFRERLETIIRLHKEISFINCTEGGAHIEGTTIKPLKEIIQIYDQYIDKSMINNDYRIKLDLSIVLKNIKKINIEIDKVIDLCKAAIKLNSQLKQLYIRKINRYYKALDNLDKIDKEIKERIKFLLIFELQIDLINTNMSNKFAHINDEEKNIYDQIEAVASKGIYLNEELIKVLEYGKPIILDCIKNLEELK